MIIIKCLSVCLSFLYGSCVQVPIELEFRSVGFHGGRKTGEPEENPQSNGRTNNKLNPRETASTVIEPGSQACIGGSHPCSYRTKP